jgi:hypothetical protein
MKHTNEDYSMLRDVSEINWSGDPRNDNGPTYVKRTAHVVVEVSWMEDEDTGSSTFEDLAVKEVEAKLQAAGIDWKVIEANEV